MTRLGLPGAAAVFSLAERAEGIKEEPTAAPTPVAATSLSMVLLLSICLIFFRSSFISRRWPPVFSIRAKH